MFLIDTSFFGVYNKSFKASSVSFKVIGAFDREAKATILINAPQAHGCWFQFSKQYVELLHWEYLSHR